MRKRKIISCCLGLAMSFGFAKAQLIETDYYYGTREYAVSKDLFDNSLIRKSEYRLIELVKKEKYSSAHDKSILLQADIDLISGNHNIALGMLGNFIKERSNSPLVPFAEIQRAYIEFERKKYSQAEVYFQLAQKSAESDFKLRQDTIYKELAHNAIYWRAISLCQQGKYLDAIPVFEQLVSEYPNGNFADDALFALGTIAEVNRQYPDAIKYYKDLQKKYPYRNTALQAYLREANNDILQRDAASALLALERAETIRRESAIDTLEKNIYEKQSYNDNAQERIYYLRGEAYNLASNYDKAIESFQLLSNNYKDSKLKLHGVMGEAWAYMNKADYATAIKLYDRAINEDDSDEGKIRASAQLYRVICLKRKGDRDQARKELAALGLQSGYPYQSLVLLELGQTNYEDADFVQARKDLERADREDSEARISVRIHLLLGATYMELKLWDKAVNEYKKAEQLTEKSSEIYLPQKKWYLAEANLKQGISLVQALRSSEAIKPLLEYLGTDNSLANQKDEAIFWLAEAYYRSDMLKNSIEFYKRLLDNYPSTKRREEALYSLGWSHFRLKEFTQSSKVFDQMIKEYPKSQYAVEVLSRQGDGYYLVKNYAQAAESYRRASRLAPNTEEGQYSAYQLCHALYRLGKYEQSITALLDFARIYNRSPYAPNALYLIGWIRFQQGKYFEAIDNFNFLLETYPQSNLVPRAHYAIADAYYNTGNYEEAINGYKNVVQNYPSSELAPEAMKSVQYALMALGREDEAMQIADQYIETNPNSPFVEDFKKKKADMFYYGRKYADAVSEYNAFIQKYPGSDKNAEVLYLLAKTYVNLNEPDRAAETFLSVKQKFPKSDFAPLSMLELALLKRDLNNPQEAEALLLNIQKEYPENEVAAQAGFERAVIKFNQGDTLSSINLYKQVANTYTNSEFGDQSRYRVAMYYRSIEKFDSARVEFEILSKIMENPSIAAEAQYRIGELWMREDNYNKAIESFIIVKDKFSGYEDWYSLSLLNLGECYEKTENPIAAKEIYTALEQLRPEDDFGKTARSRIKRLK